MNMMNLIIQYNIENVEENLHCSNKLIETQKALSFGIGERPEVLELRARQVGESKEVGGFVPTDTSISVYDQNDSFYVLICTYCSVKLRKE